MKRIIFSLAFMLFAFVWAQAQTQKVIFEYDGAGNRVLRKIGVGKITKSDTLFKSDSLFAHLHDAPINGLRVYPNPASEIVNIEFTTLPDNKVEFVLSDMNGRLIERGKISITLTPLNVQHLGKGTYILQVISGEEKERFKIVKQ